MKKIIIGALIMVSLLIPVVSVSAADSCSHVWGEWYISKEATISRTGIESRECYECNAKQEQVIAKLKPFVKFTKKTVNVKTGAETKLKIKYAKGDSVKKYKTSNKRIATVSKSGKVSAKKAGTVKITVLMKSGKKATCKVKVKARAKKKAVASGGSGTVYWTPSGSVYHSTKDCPTLSRSRSIKSGTKSSCPKNRACKVCN